MFASDPLAAVALANSGVDLIGIGNNHLYDALQTGLVDTIGALDAAGFDAGQGRFGAGLTETDAWEPAVVNEKGMSIAFLACTTISGDEHEVTYVADGPKGGAAECSKDAIRDHVATATEQYDVVVLRG